MLQKAQTTFIALPFRGEKGISNYLTFIIWNCSQMTSRLEF
jgi:hypothetical protein